MKVKAFLGVVLALFSYACISWSACNPNKTYTYTTNMGIPKPSINDCGWGTSTNFNWDVVDSSVACLSCSNVYAGTNTFTQPVVIGAKQPLRMYDSSTHFIELRASDTVTTTLYYLPPADGSNGQFLLTNGSGKLAWGSASGGGASTLGVNQNGTAISSPTVALNFISPPFSLSLVGGSTAQVTLLSSSVTLQGNTFNQANKLVQLDGSSRLPVVDGSQLTNLPSSNPQGNDMDIQFKSGGAFAGDDRMIYDGSTDMPSVYVGTDIASARSNMSNGPAIFNSINSYNGMGFYDFDESSTGYHYPIYGAYGNIPYATDYQRFNVCIAGTDGFCYANEKAGTAVFRSEKGLGKSGRYIFTGYGNTGSTNMMEIDISSIIARKPIYQADLTPSKCVRTSATGEFVSAATDCGTGGGGGGYDIEPATVTIQANYGITYGSRAVSGNFTALSTHTVILASAPATGSITVTLPLASAKSGQNLSIIKVDASTNPVIVSPAAGDTIVGSTYSVNLYTKNQPITLMSDGTNNWMAPHGYTRTPPYFGYDESTGSAQDLASANIAWFQPYYLPTYATVNGVRIRIGTQNGDIDVGIYDENGKRMASTGSTACPAAGYASILFTSQAHLSPGMYYIAIVESGFATFYRSNYVSQGLYSRSSSFPLPDKVTFPILDNNNNVHTFILVTTNGGWTL